MEQVGCASHSDFQYERDKFLKRMLECISQYELLPNGMDFVIEDLLAELRQSEIHTKDIGNVKKEDTIFTPVRHVDGE